MSYIVITKTGTDQKPAGTQQQNLWTQQEPTRNLAVKPRNWAGTQLEEDLRPWVKVDQAEGLCHRNHLTFW